MKEMTKTQLQARNREIMDKLDELDLKAKRENRKFTDEENVEYDTLMREHVLNREKLAGMVNAAELAKMRESIDKSVQLREYIKGVKEGRENATTILQNAVTSGQDLNGTANLKAGGLIPITIKDLMDTKVEGIDLPRSLRISTGVTGDEVYPYSVDDVEIRVAGEVETIGEQALNFDNIKAVSERLAAAVAVSNNAIDNASFDLYAFVVFKFQKAIRITWAKHLLSHAAWSNNLKSPFALVNAKTIVLDNNFAENLAVEVAEIADLGFTSTPELVIDKVTEARLSFRPRIGGDPASGTVIQDGKIAGFDYITSGHVNGELNGSGKYVKSSDRYIGIGNWDMVAVEQRGEARFTVDSTSAAVSARNTTVFTLNTNASITELSSKVNGNPAGDGKPQAFKLLKIVEEQETA